MKKLKKIILTILVMSLLVNPMYLSLRVHAANEELVTSRISDTLQSVMNNTTNEKIEVMIWLNDANASAAKLTSTEAILAQAKAALLPRGLCENPATDAELYSQYKAERKEALRKCYTAYTGDFADSFLFDDEVIYLSVYSPVVIASLTESRIDEISKCSSVKSLDYYCDELEESISIEQDESNQPQTRDIWFFYMNEIKQYLSINDLITYVGSNGNGIRIGVLDEGNPDTANLREIGFTNNLTIHHDDVIADYYSHPEQVLEILYSIIPNANYYYATYAFLSDTHTYTLIEEVEWLIQNNVDLITCSMHLKTQNIQGTYDGYSTYNTIASYWDHISKGYDVTILQSAGNARLTDNGYIHSGVSSGAMAYNIITVGNYDITTNTLEETSQYYQGDTYTNKPDICAPGRVRFMNGLIYSATSYSTPIVAGIAALVISYYDSIILPCEVKSILCASCSQHKYASDNENFKKYGTGVIDADYIIQILREDQQISTYIEYEDYAHTYTLGTNNSNYTYIDIVLSFDKTFFEDIGLDIANLDLYLYDSNGYLIASSTSTKNNVEVLVNIPLQSNMTLKVIQTETIPNDNTVGEEDLAVLYSVSWKMH